MSWPRRLGFLVTDRQDPHCLLAWISGRGAKARRVAERIAARPELAERTREAVAVPKPGPEPLPGWAFDLECSDPQGDPADVWQPVPFCAVRFARMAHHLATSTAC